MKPLVLLSVLSPLIPLIAGWKNRLSLLWLYALVCLLTDISISLLKRVLHVDYQWLGNIFIVAEFLLLSFVYRKQLFKSRPFFYIVLTTLSSLFIIDTLSRSVATINKVSASCFHLVYIAYAITGFYLMLKRQKVVHLEKSAFFWTNTAFLVYSSGSFLIFLLRDLMRQEEQTSKD